MDAKESICLSPEGDTTSAVSVGFRAEGPAHPLPVPLGTGLADQ